MRLSLPAGPPALFGVLLAAAVLAGVGLFMSRLPDRAGQGTDQPHHGPSRQDSVSGNISPGFRGSTTMGMRLDMNHAHQRGPTQWFMADASAQEVTGVLDLEVMLGEPGCSTAPEDLPCPALAEAQLHFMIDGSLDLGNPIAFEPPNHQAPVEDFLLVHEGAQSHTSVRVELGGLGPGTHCLLVTMTEPGEAAVVGQLPHHGFATVWELTVGRRSPNHCRAPAINDELHAVGVGDCGMPTITSDPQIPRVERTGETGQSYWALIGRCTRASETMLVALKDGRIIPDSITELAQGAATDDDALDTWVIPLGQLESGTWNVLALRWQPEAPVGVRLSEPLLIGGNEDE